MHAYSHVVKLLRQIHLYLGVFTAPAILFFAVSGVLQTFSLHEASRDGSYKPAKWIVVLAQIHKKQTPMLSPRKPLTSTANLDGGYAKPKVQSASPSSNEARHNSFPLKIFFLVIGLGLLTSTLSGLYMSWKYRRRRILLTAVFLSGIIVPVILMAI
jgi:uncharacterized iron-regulated membrane protein